MSVVRFSTLIFVTCIDWYNFNVNVLRPNNLNDKWPRHCSGLSPVILPESELKLSQSCFIYKIKRHDLSPITSIQANGFCMILLSSAWLTGLIFGLNWVRGELLYIFSIMLFRQTKDINLSLHARSLLSRVLHVN